MAASLCLKRVARNKMYSQNTRRKEEKKEEGVHERVWV